MLLIQGQGVGVMKIVKHVKNMKGRRERRVAGVEERVDEWP